jgi:predicted metal-dependent phosphoesterase TrpH
MTLLAAPDIVLTGRFTSGQAQTWAHVPFQVPPGTDQLHLRYSYSDRIDSNPLLTGGNTLDLGLFDERGTAAGSPGFRGWSGSAKDEVTIAADWATPPYRAGAIGAGTWHVLLGPYKVGPRGLDYRVEIWLNPDLPPARPPHVEMPAARRLPPPAEPGWLRCDLHCHTQFSDGDSWPDEVRAAAAHAGLDVLGITDHNSAHTGPYPNDGQRPFVLHGVEVTTYGGHWNVWGTADWHEFRRPDQPTTAASMRAAVAAGGFVSINHPRPYGPPWRYGDDLPNQAIEVWNGSWDRLNWIALAAWEAQLRRGRRLVAVGGSDTHYLKPEDAAAPSPISRPRLGEPTTWLHVAGAPTVAGLLDALRGGRCFISCGPEGPQLYVSTREGVVQARAVGATGSTLMLISEGTTIFAVALDRVDWSDEFPFPATGRYVRAQIVDQYGNVLALSNALWRATL